MLRIGICDDERASAEQLYLALEPLLRKGEEIVYEFSNGVSAANWLEKHPGEMELLFLDVEMEPVDGIRTAERIRTFDRDIFLVFVTGHEEFALSGYRVNASDQVIKPAKRERLSDLLERGLDGRPATVKKDRRNHGFGLANVEEIVERYGGSLEYKAEEKEFVLFFYLPV